MKFCIQPHIKKVFRNFIFFNRFVQPIWAVCYYQSYMEKRVNAVDRDGGKLDGLYWVKVEGNWMFQDKRGKKKTERISNHRNPTRLGSL